MYTNILIPTDGSELAGKAVRHGIALAQRIGAKVTALTASPPFHTFTTDTQMIEDTPAQYQTRGDEPRCESPRRHRRCGRERQASPATSVHVEHEHPHQAIIDTADAESLRSDRHWPRTVAVASPRSSLEARRSRCSRIAKYRCWSIAETGERGPKERLVEAVFHGRNGMAIKDVLVCLDASEAGECRLRLAAGLAREHGAHLAAAYLLRTGNNPPTRYTARARSGSDRRPGRFAHRRGERRQFEPRQNARCVAARPSGRNSRTPLLRDVATRWHPERLASFRQRRDAELIALAKTADLIIVSANIHSKHPPAPIPPGEDCRRLRPPTSGVALCRNLFIGGQARAGCLGRYPRGNAGGARCVAADCRCGRRHGHIGRRSRERPRTAASLRSTVSYATSNGMALPCGGRRTCDGIKVCDLLLSRASDLDADLIVAGAYHHSRFRETLLGGVSRELLDHMTVPVLMSH